MLNRFLVLLACALGVFASPASAQTKKALAERDRLFRTPRVLEITIELDKTNLDALRRAPRTYARATLKVADKVYPNVGIHIKGAAGSYRGIDDKPGLTINMNKFDGDALFFGMDKFHLANSVQDPGYVSELICGELFRAAGVPASRVSHALVTINGRKRGLYYLKEGYDKYFLRHHFKNADGNFYDGGFLREVDQPLQLVSSRDDVKDRSDLKALMAAAREPNPQMRMRKLEKVLDMDKFISYLAMESVTWDWDGYPMNRNNYRIYHDKQRGQLVFIPSGMDQMFGNPGGTILPGFQGFVARSVVETPEGRKRYYLRLAEIHEEILHVEKLSKRLAELQAVIQPALLSVNQGAGRDYPNQVNRLRQAITQRAKTIEQQLQGKLTDMRIQVSPLAEFYGGRAFEINNIRYYPEKRDVKTTGKLFWRRKGETKFAFLPLETVAKNRFKVSLPANVTTAAFEYFLEMQETGGKPAREPSKGEQAPYLAIPDLTPPTIVPELAATVVKSFRVTLAWKPATDDRKVAEYRVFRGLTDKFTVGEKTWLAKVAGNTHTFADNSPPSKQTTWYAVQAVDVVGRLGETRYLQVKVPDHQPPANTVKLQAIPGTKSVTVLWHGELEPIVKAMEIYRGVGKDGPMKKIGAVTDMKRARYLDKDTKFGTDYRYFARPRSSMGLLGEPGNIVTASPLRFLKRINCGGPAIATDDGVPWEADTGDGHPSLKYSGTRVWSADDNPSKDVHQSERWANVGLGYFFKLEPGRYEVVLFFAETNADFAGKGKRLFDIEINEKTVAMKVDVFTEAGGAAKPWQFRKTLDLKDGELEIKLMANPVGPAVKAIEIRGLSAKIP
ncbi:MAG: CotH kinase family protein [Planctomycetes bacterium]|nr:CotH kinase family protein [Planctomycetota bacterium]